ncbi:MAG: peptidase M6 [Firmicutes bacterium]|nr:peptidase M6 [Bacillota bacterium]
MVKKLFSVVLVLALVCGMLMPASTPAFAATDDYDVERYGDTLDIGTKLRHLAKDEDYKEDVEKQIKKSASNINPDEEENDNEAASGTEGIHEGQVKYFLANDDVEGYYVKPYTLRGLGENVEIWVANDLTFPDDRPTPVITDEQVNKLKNEFDNNIYEKDTEFFGKPEALTGENATLPGILKLPEDYYVAEDGKDRVIMLVDNVRDEAYYDPSYPFFIAGFYSPTYEGYMDRNIITIDTNNWEERLETTFFGTTAHEFQHLIHDDNDSMEETWINEGMSDFAEYLCGYGHPMGHVNFFLDHPENSLVQWDDHYSAETGPETLADYGQAYLMQLYLNDKYGQDFIQTLAKDEDHGFTSVNKVLDEFGTDIDFEELFRRFTIAVAIDSPEPGEGIYNFDSIDLKINYESALEYDKDGVPAWGGDYKEIDHAKKLQSIKIDGVEYLANPWKTVQDPVNGEGNVLWGNEGHELQNQLIFKADLSDVDTATLNFDNYILIEEQWDFGMVQVSTDNGETWESLANENTRTDVVPEGYPAIKENLPGFTGYYEDWVKEEFDLTEYAGEEILIGFNYMTDWGYNDPGWYIKNIEIPEIGYANDGSSLEGFYSIDEILESRVEYAVSFINEKSLGKGNNKQNYRVLNIDPFNITEKDTLQLKEFFSGGNNYAVIWYAAPDGKKGTVDYTYKLTTKSDYNKNKNKKKNK